MFLQPPGFKALGYRYNFGSLVFYFTLEMIHRDFFFFFFFEGVGRGLSFSFHDFQATYFFGWRLVHTISLLFRNIFMLVVTAIIAFRIPIHFFAQHSLILRWRSYITLFGLSSSFYYHTSHLFFQDKPFHCYLEKLFRIYS